MNFLIILNGLKKNILKKENIFFFFIILIIFFLDRLTKLKIINDFSDNAYYINDFINFDLIWNVGIGFGLLSTNSTLLYSFVSTLIGMVIVFLIYIFFISNRLDKLIFSLIIGGALGNLFDRLIYKAVPDFVDLHYGNFHWFTFNVADIFITIGVIIFVLISIFQKK
tara:strand:- start:3784 stop:4284 length:501 start_codon:yes stop_codon:yes gene_type:complete